jgi:hypothetical protein
MNWSDEMKVNDRKIPRIILKLDALQERLHPQHVKLSLITEEFNKRWAGHKGEMSLDYVLSLLDPHEYAVFHGVRLKIDDTFFQIDTLLISQKFILILEVKNLAGTIYFDQVFNQLIQIKDGKENGLPDPLIQIKRQESQLFKWIKQNNLPSIPIYSLVVISNDKTLIKTSSDNKFISAKVIHKYLLPSKVTQITNSINKESYTDKELKKLIKTLKKKHEEANPPILQRYNISAGEILIGVTCERCRFRPLVRMHGSWYCSKCKNSDQNGHVRALKDYELLIGPVITNKEIKRFLNVGSRHVVLRLLKSLNLPTTGTKKGTTYDLTHLTKTNQPPNKKPATNK